MLVLIFYVVWFEVSGCNNIFKIIIEFFCLSNGDLNLMVNVCWGFKLCIRNIFLKGLYEDFGVL